MKRNTTTRVVVTGLGAITALGLSAEETWKKLMAGQSGVAKGSQFFDATGYPVMIGAEVKGFDPKKYMDFKEARRTARFSQLAVAAAREAMIDAKLLDPQSLPETRVSAVDSLRIGVVMGTSAGGLSEIRNSTAVLLKNGYSRISPMFITMMLHNAAAANISRQFGLKGYNATTTTACAAGAQAIGEASQTIQLGNSDVMVAGGTESAICDVALAGFWAMRAMTATHNDDPQHASKPFDLHRDGLVAGEGAACLVLERLEHAKARGVRIYAEVMGYGCSADAYHLAMPEPNGEGEAQAMRSALTDAGLAPSDVDYISAHATATRVGDAIETIAIKQVFGQRAYQVPISAAKSMTGHAIGASGAIEAVASVLTIRDGIIHPTINYETPDPACDLDYVPNVRREGKVNVVLSNSFGMGGQNVALLFARFS